jgi:transposase
MVVREVMVDSSAVMKVEGRKRQRRSIAEKRRIVELAMLPGASVAGVARQHGVNANMVHYWRNLYRQGRLGEKRADSIGLLPVSVSEPAVGSAVQAGSKPASAFAVMPATTAGVIYLEFPKVHLRIESGADAGLVRVVLESLQR